VAMARADLEAMLDALLGNVFAHTPEKTPFAVRLDPVGDDHVRLVVEDGGPGFTSSVARGVSLAGSTGLGLDIVRKSAAAARGSLEIGASDTGGARIEVVFCLSGRGTLPPAAR
jgi:signal transduction histidine kinase